MVAYGVSPSTSSRQDSLVSTPQKQPEPTSEELSLLNPVFEKMATAPFNEEDLENIRRFRRSYTKRTGNNLTEKEIGLVTEYFKVIQRYNDEYYKCLLNSFDTETTYISDKLKKLRKELENSGNISKSKFDLDFQLLNSVAKDEIWIDDLGQEHEPLTREEILVYAESVEMIKDNLDKFLDAAINYDEQPKTNLTQTQEYESTINKLTLKANYEKNNDAVVLIRIYGENGNVVSFGSGVCIHPNGAIITNFHVLNSDSFYFDIKFQKHGVYEDAYISGISPILEDYIILRVDGKDLPSVNVSPRNEYEVGEKIITIGNPQGLTNSLSEGVVSGRRFYGDYEYYQMTAPISQGSSGGAVFDEHGYLIGISTAILEEGQNLNFFLPIYRITNNAEVFDTFLTISEFNSLRRKRAKEYKKTGDQYLLSKDYEQANNNYEISLKYYDSDADAYYAKSTAEYQLGLVDEASVDLFMAAAFYYLNDKKGKLINVKRRAKEMSLPAEVVDIFDIQNMENIFKGYNKGDDLRKQFTSKNNLTKDIPPLKEKSTIDTTPLVSEELQEEAKLEKSDGNEVLQKLEPFFSGLVVSEKEHGVKIVEITQGCIGFDAGLRTGDVITEIDGKKN